MKFVIQNDAYFDFTFHIEEAINFYKWYNEVEVKVIYSKFEDLDKNIKLNDEYIPVGSVQFAHKTMQLQTGKHYEPNQLNVPAELFNKIFTKRDIFIHSGKFTNNRTKSLFYKSQDTVKGKNGLLHPNESLEDGQWFISEKIDDIKSEWRGFVYEGELIDLRLYSGDFRALPNIELIDNMVKTYNKKEPYTIDVGVCREGTFIIECHRFYSCGLYGFNDSRTLLKMVIGGYKELKELYLCS